MSADVLRQELWAHGECCDRYRGTPCPGEKRALTKREEHKPGVTSESGTLKIPVTQYIREEAAYGGAWAGLSMWPSLRMWKLLVS